ncbi:LrgB family protein [Halorhodospira halochloris]|uniref:LrgB family protein n=1 Tax=Halorhodospira halochloris TaxID=1052 RepID=UPI001EE8FFFD|nr:LrgB family protein [Halorhodospira halochloris]MCG5547718.1 LrgB family protein [Halorhodospira halochloris]
MAEDFEDIWAYLAESPLLGLTATLFAFLVAQLLWERIGRPPILHPVLMAMALLMAFLVMADIDYDTYFEGAQFIHFLLGPATVALAIPLFDQLHRIRRLLLPISVAVVVGSLSAALSAILVGAALGASYETLLSLAPKSVTSPIAMGITERLGGLPSLTAGLVLVTGALGCLMAPLIFRLLGIRDETAQGFSLGLAAHGFGTAQAFGIGAAAGAFAGLALGLAGLVTAVFVPLLLPIIEFLSV